MNMTKKGHYWDICIYRDWGCASGSHTRVMPVGNACPSVDITPIVPCSQSTNCTHCCGYNKKEGIERKKRWKRERRSGSSCLRQLDQLQRELLYWLRMEGPALPEAIVTACSQNADAWSEKHSPIAFITVYNLSSCFLPLAYRGIATVGYFTSLYEPAAS